MTWYHEDIKRLEKERAELTYDPKLIFYGSSSITLWDTLYADFKEYKPVNLGFGGSTLAACVWFFEQVVAPYNPEAIILYAGDNDLGDGRHAEEVFIFYQQFIAKVRQHFGQLPVYFISIKPSISRHHIIGKIKYANNLIEHEISRNSNQHYIDIYHKMLNKKGYPREEFFKSDHLHLSQGGYKLWKETIESCLQVNHI